jgi:hypothetical protein
MRPAAASTKNPWTSSATDIKSALPYESWVGRDEKAGAHGHAEGDHFGNFIDCVRSRKKENLNAPIQEGEQVVGDDEANKLLRDGDRGYRTPFVVPEEV